MRWVLAMLLIFADSLPAGPEEGKAAAEAFLAQQKVKLSTPNYQEGANYIAGMKYERETEKHATWQQNQNIAPSCLEQTGAQQAMSENMG